DGIRDRNVTGVQTCALPISANISKFSSIRSAILVKTKALSATEVLPQDFFAACAASNASSKSLSFERGTDVNTLPSTGETTSKRSEEHTSELQSRFDIVCRL